jgi:aminopeptidase Y
MRASSAVALCATVSSAAAFNIPFLSTGQQPLHLGGDEKPLVDSEALQDLISGDRLMKRAKELFEIAKLGEEEYNHPTRVIGSDGNSAHVTVVEPLLINVKAISELYHMSTEPSLSSEITTRSQISPSPQFLAMSLNPGWSLAPLFPSPDDR